jgi:hypothetical protein
MMAVILDVEANVDAGASASKQPIRSLPKGLGGRKCPMLLRLSMFNLDSKLTRQAPAIYTTPSSCLSLLPQRLYAAVGTP